VSKLRVAVDSLELIHTNEPGRDFGLGELVVRVTSEGEVQTLRESLNEIYCGLSEETRQRDYREPTDVRGRLGVAMKRLGERLMCDHENDVFTPNPELVSKE
jgi:hypothetical protein